MDATSTHTERRDPLYAEHRRLWEVIPQLVNRLGELDALPNPTEDEQREIELLFGQIAQLRRMTVRICEVWRAEGWARAREGR